MMAIQFPRSIIAVHLNFIPSPPPPTFLHPLLPSLLCGAPPSASLFSRFLGRLAGLIDTAVGPFVGENVGLSSEEVKGVARGRMFGKRGNAYLLEHATRPATIGIVVGSSPIALLAWVRYDSIQSEGTNALTHFDWVWLNFPLPIRWEKNT